MNETINDTIVNAISPNGQVDPSTLSDGITVIHGAKVGDSLLPMDLLRTTHIQPE